MSEVHRYSVVKMLTEEGNKISYDPHGPEIVVATHYDAVVAQRDELLEALTELVTDMVIAQGNMRDAAKHDPRWEGCADAIQPRIDASRAAIAKARGN